MVRSVSLAILIALSSGPAWAHAFLKTAVPSVGSTIAEAPPSIVIEFTEGVEPMFSTITLQNANGQPIKTGPIAPASGNRLTLKLPPIPPGTYTVVWHATAVDTHKTEGKFDFTFTPK